MKPWKEKWRYDITDECVLREDDERVFAAIDDRGFPDGPVSRHVDACGHLAAAAPDLYRALEAVVRANPPGVDRDRALAALRKARGEK